MTWCHGTSPSKWRQVEWLPSVPQRNNFNDCLIASLFVIFYFVPHQGVVKVLQSIASEICRSAHYPIFEALFNAWSFLLNLLEGTLALRSFSCHRNDGQGFPITIRNHSPALAWLVRIVFLHTKAPFWPITRWHGNVSLSEPLWDRAPSNSRGFGRSSYLWRQTFLWRYLIRLFFSTFKHS